MGQNYHTKLYLSMGVGCVYVCVCVCVCVCGGGGGGGGGGGAFTTPNISLYPTKSLKAWDLQTDVLELSTTDFLSLAAACLCKWPRQPLAPTVIISPSNNFPIKVLSPILWAHGLTLASKPRVDALVLVSFLVVPCSHWKHMSPGSDHKLL